MNMTRKLASVVLAMILVLCVASTAMAAMEGTMAGGSITINDAVEGQTYNAYQILYLESYNAESKAYAYKANSAWADWLATQEEYVAIDDQGYVTWVSGADAAAFAKAAQAYADANKIAPVKDAVTATSTTVKFEGLNLGYYLVDTTLGTLCSLDTTNPTVVMEEKNEVPTNEKKVKEDSTGDYGSTNDADIGQVVEFQSTITAQAGAESYIFHDKMSAGLTYDSVTGITLNGTAVESANYTVVTENLGDGCTFEVQFTQAFCDNLKANDKIVISYTATVNSDATIGLPGNPNESSLSYGENSQFETVPSETITYTWDMDVLKYANGVEEDVLSGAKFVLLDSTKKSVANISNGKLVGWVTITEGMDLTPYELTTDANGKIEIDGLDADTYYLRETKAPDGYNKLAADVEVKVTGATTKEDSTELSYTTVVAKVNNQSGSELPSTGGMGTTLFYVVGGVLVVAAFILMVTKRRVGTEK